MNLNRDLHSRSRQSDLRVYIASMSENYDERAQFITHLLVDLRVFFFFLWNSFTAVPLNDVVMLNSTDVSNRDHICTADGLFMSDISHSIKCFLVNLAMCLQRHQIGDVLTYQLLQLHESHKYFRPLKTYHALPLQSIFS